MKITCLYNILEHSFKPSLDGGETDAGGVGGPKISIAALFNCARGPFSFTSRLLPVRRAHLPSGGVWHATHYRKEHLTAKVETSGEGNMG